MAQWGEHSPPADVARVRYKELMSYGAVFVVGSCPCSKGFFGTLVFLHPQKPTFSNFNSTRKQWTKSHSADVPLK